MGRKIENNPMNIVPEMQYSSTEDNKIKVKPAYHDESKRKKINLGNQDFDSNSDED